MRILGKGNKWRVCPLWPITVAALRPLVAGRSPEDRVFRGRTGEPMTRFGLHRLVTTYAGAAGKQVKSMQDKRVSPHTIRHTTAVHLLRAGVDINTIRAWLGHVSLDTTHIYAEVDLEMKAKALELDITDLPAAAFTVTIAVPHGVHAGDSNALWPESYVRLAAPTFRAEVGAFLSAT